MGWRDKEDGYVDRGTPEQRASCVAYWEKLKAEIKANGGSDALLRRGRREADQRAARADIQAKQAEQVEA